MKKIIFLLFLILPIKYSVASCTNGQADSTCISATPMTYNNTSNTPNTPQTYNSTSNITNTPQTYNSTSNITNTPQIQQCTNSSAGYYQNTQSPGGCLYKAPPQCPAGQTQTSAPYWDTLNDTWNGLQCQNPPPAKPTCPQGQTQTSAPTWNGSSWVGLQCAAPPPVTWTIRIVRTYHTGSGTVASVYSIVCSNGKSAYGSHFGGTWAVTRWAQQEAPAICN